MSFEQALDALERIVDDLERGDVPLDQSIRIYERGEALKAHCDRLLKAAEDKVEKIRLSRDGKPVGRSRSTANRHSLGVKPVLLRDPSCGSALVARRTRGIELRRLLEPMEASHELLSRTTIPNPATPSPATRSN